MKENKNFFMGVFVGIFISIILVSSFIKIAFEDRGVRGLLFDTVKKISLLTDEIDTSKENNTTVGENIDWVEVSRKSNELYNTIDDYYLNEIDNNKICSNLKCKNLLTNSVIFPIITTLVTLIM